MKIKIKVTKEVIQQSKFCELGDAGLNCAIALAVRSLFPNAKVRGQYIAFFDESWHYQTSTFLPPIAERFIDRFDRNTPDKRERMQPVSFEVDVPDSIIDKIGISQVHKILSKSKTLEYVG